MGGLFFGSCSRSKITGPRLGILPSVAWHAVSTRAGSRSGELFLKPRPRLLLDQYRGVSWFTIIRNFYSNSAKGQ